MKRKSICLLLCAVLCCMTLPAKEMKRPDGFNYLRGYEAVQNQKYDEARDYFLKDLQENPKNGYSYSWLGMIYSYEKRLGDALTASNLALKYLPKKDVEFVAASYSIRADVYLELEDTVKAMADFDAAIRVQPNESKRYEERAQLYYEQGKYELADADYQKIVKLNPGGVMGYMGLGRDAIATKRWNEALEQFDFVIKLTNNYSSAYSFRAETYMGMKKWPEATDDIMTAFAIDWDQKAYYMALALEEPAFSMLVSKLKIKAAKELNVAGWPYTIGVMYEQVENYNKAIEYYEICNIRDANASVYQRISDCYEKLGNYYCALKNINQALNMDSVELGYKARKANIYYDLGDVDAAISEWDAVLAAQPEYGWGYFKRGRYKFLNGDTEGAIEDLSMSIVLSPDCSHAYITRGSAYLKQGKTALADEDFWKVIELEDTPDKYEHIIYAYQALGMNDKAVEALDTIIARDTTSADNYYEATCLYARMGNKATALQMLEKSLKLGYKSFEHIKRDFDLDPIRETTEFKALIEKYKPMDATIGSEDVQGDLLGGINLPMPTVTEVPFTKEDGVCKVKCQINGLPLHFVFDTGASDVTLSMVEATFMMKNGYLSSADVVGSQNYMDANGDISVGTTINLKKVQFGEFELTNVRASVVRNQRAPLLLGQSVLGRLGKIEIDNGRNVLKITHY